MPKYVKFLSLTFVVYFFLLGLFGLACLIHFNKDYEQNGGDMGPMYFFVYYCMATAYYSSFLVWSFRLYQGKTTLRLKYALVQLLLIFVLGVGSSLFILWRMFAT
jgi:hypothetical protein